MTTNKKVLTSNKEGKAFGSGERKPKKKQTMPMNVEELRQFIRQTIQDAFNEKMAVLEATKHLSKSQIGGMRIVLGLDGYPLVM